MPLMAVIISRVLCTAERPESSGPGRSVFCTKNLDHSLKYGIEHIMQLAIIICNRKTGSAVDSRYICKAFVKCGFFNNKSKPGRLAVYTNFKDVSGTMPRSDKA